MRDGLRRFAWAGTRFLADMKTSKVKPKRTWRPRFSVRSLVILVTLWCCYLGARQATNTICLQSILRSRIISPDGKSLTSATTDDELQDALNAIIDARTPCIVIEKATSPAPLIVAQSEGMFDPSAPEGEEFGYRDSYYLWWLGGKIRIPIGPDWKTIRITLVP